MVETENKREFAKFHRIYLLQLFRRLFLAIRVNYFYSAILLNRNLMLGSVFERVLQSLLLLRISKLCY